jgi:hypothetical protein
VGRIAGKRGRMVRTVSALALVVVVVAGCGGSAPSHHAVRHGVPRRLAREWATEASTLAAVAAAGDSCRARRLAGSLRSDVISARSRVPERLRIPLLQSVNSLADGITCTPATTQTPPPPEPPPKHDHHGHDQGHDHDHGHGQGGDG